MAVEEAGELRDVFQVEAADLPPDVLCGVGTYLGRADGATLLAVARVRFVGVGSVWKTMYSIRDQA